MSQSPAAQVFDSSFSCGTWSGQPFNIQGTSFDAWCGQDTSGPVTSISSSTLQDCATACASDSTCKAASWTFGTCYLKGEIGNILPNEHVDSFTISVGDGPTQPTLDCPDDNGLAYNGFTLSCSTDFPGIGDMGSSNQPTIEDCIDSCADASGQGCVAVVYTGDACYLKNQIGPAVSNGNTRAAIKAGTTATSPTTGPTCPNADGTTVAIAGSKYTIYCDKEYPGGDLAAAQFDTFEECVTECSNTPGCIDVSYRGVGCYMKSEITALVSAPGLSTAVLVSATTEAPPASQDPSQFQCPFTGSRYYTSNGARFQVDCSTDYFGGDLVALDTTTAEGCMDACATNSQCVGASYRGNGCYLKSTLEPIIGDSGVLGIALLAATTSTTSTSTTTTTTTSTTPTTTTTTSTTTSTTTTTTTSALPLATGSCQSVTDPFLTSLNKSFNKYCDTLYYGDTLLQSQPAASGPIAVDFAACAERCAATPNCLSIVYVQGSFCDVWGGTPSNKGGGSPYDSAAMIQ